MKAPQETNDTYLQSRDQYLSIDAKMSQFEQEFGSECCSEVRGMKMETLKTNLLFLNPFAKRNKKMTIVFVSQYPKESKKAKN